MIADNDVSAARGIVPVECFVARGEDFDSGAERGMQHGDLVSDLQSSETASQVWNVRLFPN